MSEIKNMWTKEIIIQDDNLDIKQLLEKAIEEKINLSWANLSGTNLSKTNLSKTNLSWANLSWANLSGADLSGANLYGADLSGANLSGANLPYYKILPEEGEFICYKKVFDDIGGFIILTLKIPEKSLRVSTLSGRKCRVSCAIPIKSENLNGDLITEITEFKNMNFRHPYTWRMNEENFPDNGFSEDIREECLPGLHVFLTKDEAKAFEL